MGLNLLTNRGSKVYIPFLEALLDPSKITMIMAHNKKKKKRAKKIESALWDYSKKKKKQDMEYQSYIYRACILLEIYANDISTAHKKEPLEDIAKSYSILRSELYKIITFRNNSTTIVDNSQKITLKKSNQSDNKSVVSDMLDIAVLKNWDLGSLHIVGDKVFVLEIRRQAAERIKFQNNLDERKNCAKYRKITY
jgi:hypothetical protein